MNWGGKKSEPNGAALSAGVAISLPAAMIEIQPAFVVGSRFVKSGQAGIRRIAVKAIEPGVVNPSPLLPNIAKPDALGDAMASVSKAIGNGGGRAGLLLPDGALRVCLLEFETLPAKAKDLDSLLRWRIKDSIGFAPEEARLAYQECFRAAGRVELLVLAARADVLAQYEAALEGVRGAPVLTLPATLALLPLLPGTEPGGQLLTHVCSGWVTHALVEGNRLRFWRTRYIKSGDHATGAEEVISEAARAAASARDRLGVEISKAWLCSRPAPDEALRSALSAALGLSVADLADGCSRAAGMKLDMALDAEERPLFDMFAAPLAGLITNAETAA